eukprot:746570-Rhodomonas_salina.6
MRYACPVLTSAALLPGHHLRSTALSPSPEPDPGISLNDAERMLLCAFWRRKRATGWVLCPYAIQAAYGSRGTGLRYLLRVGPTRHPVLTWRTVLSPTRRPYEMPGTDAACYYQVLRRRCTDVRGQLPYAPMHELLRARY